MRHIEIRHYFVADNVACGMVDIRYCLTEEMCQGITPAVPASASESTFMLNCCLSKQSKVAFYFWPFLE